MIYDCYLFFSFNLNLKIRTVRHAANWRFITKLKTRSLTTNIAYNDVMNVVDVQIV